MRPIVGDALEQAERLATRRAHVRFAGRELQVSTNAEDHLEWLRLYTSPQYEIRAGGSGRADICSIDDTALEARLRDDLVQIGGRDIALYKEYPAIEVDLGDWRALVHTSRPNIILVSRRERRCVTIGSPRDIEAKLEPVRCMRELFTKTLESEGQFVLHAGAVTVDGHGVACCGASGSGKSTVVLSLVEAGSGFLSNDRIHVGYDDDSFWMHPWPTTTPVGMGTLFHFPTLRAWFERGGWAYELQEMMSPDASYERFSKLSPSALAKLPDKLQLTTAEIAASLGSHVAAAGPLRCIVLPRIDLSEPGVVIEPAPPEEARRVLLRETLTPHDSGYPDWLGFRSESEEHLTRQAHALVDQLVEEVPCMSVRFSSLRAGGAERLVRSIRSQLDRSGAVLDA